MKLREVTYSRAGDKGNSNNVAVIPKSDEDLPIIQANLTKEKIAAAFQGYDVEKIEINYYDKLNMFNILIFGALNGGVSMNYNLDRHGKSFSDIVLDIELDK